MARPITTAGQTLQESDPRRQYSDDEVDSGLLLLAIYGSPTRAAEHLSRDLGRPVSQSAVRYWRDHAYADRYLELRRTIVPQIRQRLAERHEDAALLAIEKNIALSERLSAEDIKQEDIPKAMQQTAMSSAISIDKASLLRDMPTQIVAHMDAEENLDAIARLVPGAVVDSTAVEEPVTDAVEVE